MALSGAYSKVVGGVVTSHSLVGTFTDKILDLTNLINLRYQLSGDGSSPVETETVNSDPVGGVVDINLVTCSAYEEGGKTYALRQGSEVVIGLQETVRSICLFDLDDNLIARMMVVDSNGVPTSINMEATETYMVSVNIALDITALPLIREGDGYTYEITYPSLSEGAKLEGFYSGDFENLVVGDLVLNVQSNSTTTVITTEEFTQTYDPLTRTLSLTITLLPEEGINRSGISISGSGEGSVVINFPTLLIPRLVGITFEFEFTWGS